MTARVLLVATPATVTSEIYQNAFRMIGKEITALAIPDLASAIEFGSSDEEIETIIRDAFDKVTPNDYDVLVLACTHYPLVAPIFKKVVGTLPLFDPATAVAERVKKRLWPREVGEGRMRYLISKDSPQFRARVGSLFPASTADIEVVD